MGGDVVGEGVRRSSGKSLFPALSFALVATAGVSLSLGKYPVSLRDTVMFFLHKAFNVGHMTPDASRLLGNLLLDIRLPAHSRGGPDRRIPFRVGGRLSGHVRQPPRLPGPPRRSRRRLLRRGIRHGLSEELGRRADKHLCLRFCRGPHVGRHGEDVQGQHDPSPGARRRHQQRPLHLPFVGRQIRRRPLQPTSRHHHVAHGRALPDRHAHPRLRRHPPDSEHYPGDPLLRLPQRVEHGRRRGQGPRHPRRMGPHAPYLPCHRRERPHGGRWRA